MGNSGMCLGLGLGLARQAGGRRDPLEGVPVFGHWTTHHGDHVPVGMYEDEGCTTRSLEAGQTVVAFRDEKTGLTFVDQGETPSTLEFYDGVPVIRTNESTCFMLGGTGEIFDGTASVCVQASVAPDGGDDNSYGLFSTILSAVGPWGRYHGNGKSYPWFFFPDSRIEAYRTMPSGGPLLWTGIHDGSDYIDWLNGAPGGPVAKGFSVSDGYLYLAGAGIPASGLNGAITGVVIGPAWTDRQRLAVESLLAKRHIPDRLLKITGLSVWRRNEGVFQDSLCTIEAAVADAVGGWRSNRGDVLAQPDNAKRFVLADGWVASDNIDDALQMAHVRSNTYTAIARVKLTQIGDQFRQFSINSTGVGQWQSPRLGIVNELVTWDYTVADNVVLNQVATLRLVRESPTLVKLYLDGVLISTIAGAQAADGSGVIQLVCSAYAGFAYADRILTGDEIAAVESDMEFLDP